MRNLFFYCVCLCISFSSLTAHAYLGLNETGELLPDNYYRVGVAPEAILSSGGGFNVGVYADMHLFDAADARITIGAGKIDFWSMASLKWVPFPDVDRQPAIGLRAGLGYTRDEDMNFVVAQLTPLLSKKADTRYGNMIPYIGVPVTWTSTKDSSYVASQFAIGAEWFPRDDKHVGVEIDLNMNKSISTLTVFFSFPFEGSTGYIKK